MKTRSPIFVILFICLGIPVALAQQTTTIGKGNLQKVNVFSSSTAINGQRTLTSTGFLPNYSAAARFLSQATFGNTYTEIQKVANQGIEKWLDDQLAMSNSFRIETYVQNLHQSMVEDRKSVV